MLLKDVKSHLGKTVYYDTGQVNFDGCSINEFMLRACILRRKNKGTLFYQAELMSLQDGNSLIIVPLEKVLTRNEV